MSVLGPIDPQTLPLRDIHLPDPVSWWPPAVGWWLMAGLILLLGTAFAWWWRRWLGGRYRRLALRELEQLQQLPVTEQIAALSRLLRQTALCHFPRAECAGLHGEDWLKFLDRPFKDQPFSQGAGRCLLDAPYRPHSSIDDDELLELCRRWLKQLPQAGANRVGP